MPPIGQAAPTIRRVQGLLAYQLTGGSAVDNFNIFGGGQFTIDAGMGQNSLYVDGLYQSPASGTFSSGDGSDNIYMQEYIGTWTVDTGGGADNINFDGVYSLRLQPGSYNFTIHAGDGNDSIYAGGLRN